MPSSVFISSLLPFYRYGPSFVLSFAHRLSVFRSSNQILFTFILPPSCQVCLFPTAFSCLYPIHSFRVMCTVLALFCLINRLSAFRFSNQCILCLFYCVFLVRSASLPPRSSVYFIRFNLLSVFCSSNQFIVCLFYYVSISLGLPLSPTTLIWIIHLIFFIYYYYLFIIINLLFFIIFVLWVYDPSFVLSLINLLSVFCSSNHFFSLLLSPSRQVCLSPTAFICPFHPFLGVLSTRPLLCSASHPSPFSFPFFKSGFLQFYSFFPPEPFPTALICLYAFPSFRVIITVPALFCPSSFPSWSSYIPLFLLFTLSVPPSCHCLYSCLLHVMPRLCLLFSPAVHYIFLW